MLTKALLQIYCLGVLISVIDSPGNGDNGSMMPIMSYRTMLRYIIYLNDVDYNLVHYRQ
jgi:hypothetical protein